MDRVIELARNDLRIFLTDRGNIVGLLMLPIILTLIIGFVNGGMFDRSVEQLRIDILDHDQSELSRELLAGIREANSSLVLCPVDQDPEDFCQLGDAAQVDRERAMARLEDGTTLAMIEIPAGFSSAVQNFRPAAVVFLSVETFAAPDLIQQAVDAAIQRVNGAAVASLVGTEVITGLAEGVLPPTARETLERSIYERADRLWEQVPVRVILELTAQTQERSAGQVLQTGLGQSVPGMGAMFVMFTVFGGMTALIVERKQGTLQRLAVMPISRVQLLGGKIAARFSLGILQYLIVFAVGAIVGMSFGEDPLALALVVLAYTLAVTALSFALGTRLDNEVQASGFSLLLSFILAPLGGAWWPLEIVPEFMRLAGHISPVAWAMDAFTALIFEGASLSAVLLPTGVLLGIAAACFGLAVWRFEYN